MISMERLEKIDVMFDKVIMYVFVCMVIITIEVSILGIIKIIV